MSFPDFAHSDFDSSLSPRSFALSFSRLPTELGEGPFSLVSAVHNDTMFGVNRTSSLVFPLVRERPGQLPAPGLLFNFMITAGLQKDKTSRKYLCQRELDATSLCFYRLTTICFFSQVSLWCHWSLQKDQTISLLWAQDAAVFRWSSGVEGRILVAGQPLSNTRGCFCQVTPRSSLSANVESFCP